MSRSRRPQRSRRMNFARTFQRNGRKSRVTINLPEEEVKRLIKELQQFPTKLRNKILRNGFKEWGQTLKSAIKGNITWDDPKMSRNVHQKIKTFKRGKVMWSAVGIKTGHNGNEELPGWRAHFYDNGFRVYPKGRPTDRKGKGRGWRQGLRGVLGDKIYNTKFITKAADAHQKDILPIVQKKIQETLQDMTRINNGK